MSQDKILSGKAKKRPSDKIDDLLLRVAQHISINFLDYIDNKKYKGFLNRIDSLPISTIEKESLKEDFKNLFGEDSLSTTSKKTLISKITNNVFEEIIRVVSGELKNLKIRNFGTFELRKHGRFGTWQLKFVPSTEFSIKLKNQNVIDDPAFMEELYKQSQEISKALDAKNSKGDNS